jgi:hypothetical protein
MMNQLRRDKDNVKHTKDAGGDSPRRLQSRNRDLKQRRPGDAQTNDVTVNLRLRW